MKRIALKDFAKQQKNTPQNMEQLLGNVLGACHDDGVRQKFAKAKDGISNDVKF